MNVFPSRWLGLSLLVLSITGTTAWAADGPANPDGTRNPPAEYSLVGVWQGSCVVGNATLDLRTTIRADGSYLTVWTSGNLVSGESGAYKLADGAMTITPDGTGVVTRSQITWVSRDEFVYVGAGLKVTFHRR